MKKYKLTKECKERFGRKLYRIKALKNFNDVKKGELGGFIEKIDNLSDRGDAWVYGDAEVYGELKIKSGEYFGVQFKGEVIRKKKLKDGDYLLYK